MNQPVINVQNFSKSFGKVEVVSDLSFEVNPGEIFAFLGANGSGKTTTIRCLLGTYAPTSGKLEFLGKRYTSQMSETLGYLPEERGLYLDAQVLETIAYFGTLKGMSQADANKAAGEYLERVGLADKGKEKIKTLSSGQQQKIQLGITVINTPKVLILDEPTKGLDPVNRNLLMDLLDELNQKHGTTIMYSTHQMDTAEQIADRLVMIKNGNRELYGSVDEVKDEFGENTVIVEFSGKLPTKSNLYKVHEAKTNYAEIEKGNDVDPNEIIKELLEANVSIKKFAMSRPSLHQIFIEVQQRQAT